MSVPGASRRTVVQQTVLTRRSSREIWWALFAILLITLVYFLTVGLLQQIPPAAGLFGHLIGILGFVLMLMTETLYTLRKRSRTAHWGKISSWLNFHIFTGIVGPYMVLIHTSWKFNGLAGLTMLLTIVIVVSGFIGRYIYTSIPRAVDGAELEASNLEREVASTQAEIQSLVGQYPQDVQIIQRLGEKRNWLQRMQWHSAVRQMKPEMRFQVELLEQLIQRQKVLNRQVQSLAASRRLMALWHTIHIPIGMMLFTAAFIHIVAAIYYATLLR